MYAGQGDTGVKLSYEWKISQVLVMMFSSSPLFLVGAGEVLRFSAATFRKRVGMKQVLLIHFAIQR